MLGKVLGKVVEKAKKARLAAVWRAAAMEVMEARQMLAGNGLAATYFDNENFTGKTASRVDATVDFNWGTGAPVSGFGADTYSAKWSGQVETGAGGWYTFYTQSDDGVRVWVNG